MGGHFFWRSRCTGVWCVIFLVALIGSGFGQDTTGVVVPNAGGLSESWSEREYSVADIWAFLPLRQPEIPGATESSHPIDAFINRQLRKRGIDPAPEADAVSLLRRATLGLTGLPPTMDEVEVFQADSARGDSGDGHGGNATYERVIDRLLASRRYGERMAQHWLDVVRYADTAGLANDWERPHAWRYRDYVVHAFNTDKPYDRFVLEQIAGDELDPESSECLIAVGFLRMGPWEHTGMSVAAITRQQFLDDVTNSVGVTFLGQELRCARCHDHKFDPVPTRDYYSIQAAFSSTQFAERAAPFEAWEHTDTLDEARQRTARQLGAAALHGEAGKKNDALVRNTRKREAYLELARKRHEPLSFSVRTAKAESTHILRGGALDAPANPVTPGVLSAVAVLLGDGPPARRMLELSRLPQGDGGRRLALARWIASADNPLTARAIVNRVWQWHFGRGLVATPNNLGASGSRPTHPELLDWLASWFVEEGWSIKKLHRLIMTSAAYRRGTEHSERQKLGDLDPRNDLLAVFTPRRLTAEEIRDGMLWTSGELSSTMGGPGVFPEIDWEVALQPRHIMGAIAPAYQPSNRPATRHRRTLYAFRIRTLADPMLEVLNRPVSDISCERRDETTVTPQVFSLFNSQFVHDRAIALARRIERSADKVDGRIELAFRLLFARPPTPDQRETCRRHVTVMTDHHRAHDPVVVTPPSKVAREMIAEQTGELFRWEETLELMDQFQADLKPWDVDPETRALAELCLVLFNSNEFVYVY